MQNSLDKIAPVVEKTVQHKPLQSWFNLKLRNLKKKKCQAERRYKKLPNKYNLQEFKKQQMTYYSNIRQVKVDYYFRILQNSEKNTKLLYTMIQKLSGDTIQRVLPSGYATKTLVEMFSKYFYEKITIIRSTIKVKSSEINFATNVNTNKDTQLYEMSEFSPLSIAELASIISCINNKSCHYDPSPVNLIKQCSDITFPILQLIINKSFKEAKVPHQLKRANVSPIIKNKDLDPDNLKNYRPINNIPFIAKVLEKAVFYQVNEHLQKHGLYSLNQSGYRENHSCETTLLKIVDDMQKTIHIDNLSAVLMLDLSAAFDTVDQRSATFSIKRANVPKFLQIKTYSEP